MRTVLPVSFRAVSLFAIMFFAACVQTDIAGLGEQSISVSVTASQKKPKGDYVPAVGLENDSPQTMCVIAVSVGPRFSNGADAAYAFRDGYEAAAYVLPPKNMIVMPPLSEYALSTVFEPLPPNEIYFEVMGASSKEEADEILNNFRDQARRADYYWSAEVRYGPCSSSIEGAAVLSTYDEGALGAIHSALANSREN
ncbi:hypothetical protein SAMN04488117_11870 [Celeribacter baekdonensis]|uniref:SPOR domain-containing protein n=1 Tax=Celeribacter baekdonensis TaxID=875171 RepID=A0A1G7TVC5_9RHOB|nr:hypothetical protein [Celeribacter baekdonensis]SDG38689.1 hypothetical protein SAMN04488117_11870 [Celeribacter baekdonensis]